MSSDGHLQSMGRVEWCFHNAAEAFFSSLEWESPVPTGTEHPRPCPGRHAGGVTRSKITTADTIIGMVEPDQLRENRGPRPGSRIRNPPRFGESQIRWADHPAFMEATPGPRRTPTYRSS